MGRTRDGRGQGWPARAKILACVVLIALVATVTETIELVRPGLGWAHFKLWGGLTAVVYWPLAWILLSKRYGEERTAREHKHRRERQVIGLGRIWRYLVPVAAVGFLIIGLIDGIPSWRAAHGAGRAGILTLQSRSCDRRSCIWRGQFVSDDEAVRRDDVDMHDEVPRDARVGSQIRARDTGDWTGVFAESNSGYWRGSAVFVFGSVAFLLVWACSPLVIRWRRRVAARTTAIPGDLQ